MIATVSFICHRLKVSHCSIQGFRVSGWVEDIVVHRRLTRLRRGGGGCRICKAPSSTGKGHGPQPPPLPNLNSPMQEGSGSLSRVPTCCTHDSSFPVQKNLMRTGKTAKLRQPPCGDSSAGHAHFAHTRALRRCTGYAFTVSEHFTHGSGVRALASRLPSHFHMFPVGGRGTHSAPGCSTEECVCL